MSTVRHQLSTANSIRRFSLLHNQSQRLIARMHLSTSGLRVKLPDHGETAKQKDNEKKETLTLNQEMESQINYPTTHHHLYHHYQSNKQEHFSQNSPASSRPAHNRHGHLSPQ
jgi:hypothetical protein